MEQIIEMFYKAYSDSEFEKKAEIEDYDSKTKEFFKSLSKKQHGLFLDVESEYLHYAVICEKKAIAFMLSLIIDEE